MPQQPHQGIPPPQQHQYSSMPQQAPPPMGVAMTTTAYTNQGSLPTSVQGPPSSSQAYPVTTGGPIPIQGQGQPPPQHAPQQQLLM